MGILVYVLLVGSAPWLSQNLAKIKQESLVGYISFTNPVWKKVSKDAMLFVKKLLSKDNRAPNTIQLLLNDYFLQEN